MRTYIRQIGVIDFDNNVHAVSFEQGINLITGKSSTGKSSIMEIFDYCMGSNEDTIAEGIIKQNANFYFVDITIKEQRFLIGRKNHSAFYLLRINQEIPDNDKGVYFAGKKSINSDDFKIQLGLLLGIDVENTKESDEDERRRGMVGRPTVRNMMPFILQHQSLIANKLALFYRFDEREKKEQTIEQFKIFAGIVDAKYYDLKRQSSTLEKKIKGMDIMAEKHRALCRRIFVSLETKIDKYKQITGKDLFLSFSEKDVLSSPDSFLKLLENRSVWNIEVDDDNSNYMSSYKKLSLDIMSAQRKLRSKQIELSKINDSIAHIESYKLTLEKTLNIDPIEVHYSICPICHQHTDSVTKEAESLQNAYQTVRRNICMSASLIRPQYELKHKVEKEIDEIVSEIRVLHEKEKYYAEVIEKLKKQRSLQEQAYEVIVGVRSLLEEISAEPYSQSEYNQLKTELGHLQKQLERYNVSRTLKEAELKINDWIEKYRVYFPFENSLLDYKLVFDIKNFEVKFESKDSIIRLRSLGSGANWLSVHLCLFLAINKYLYDRTESCVPTVLFIDQPSQVYFPSIDKNVKFDADDLHKKSGKDGSGDEDMVKVEGIFSSLYAFSLANPGFQLIITDHADNLHIDGLDSFDRIVRARWRRDNDGLIDINRINSNNIVNI